MTWFKPHNKAIAITLAIALMGLVPSLASADNDDDITYAGPILSIDQVILVVRAAQPDAAVDEIEIEQDEETGLVYRVKLTDKTRVYVNAQTGEIIEIDD